MANTFTQIHIHAVFAVQNRMSLIQKPWQKQLYKYIITIIQKHGHKVLSIGGIPDHIHILFGFRPTQALYIETQEEHHKKKTFIDEYKKILNDFDIEYDERYIFKPIEE